MEPKSTAPSWGFRGQQESRLEQQSSRSRPAQRQPLSDHYATGAKAYRDGTGANVDLMKSYIWFSIAAQTKKGEAQTERDKIAARLTASQLTEAQNLVRRMYCR